MTEKELSRLAQQVQVRLPAFGAHRSLLFLKPLRETLRGVFFGRSSAKRGFYVEVFFQLLCVPSQHIYFNLGWRLKAASDLWDADEPLLLSKLTDAVERHAVPFLEPILTPRDAALAGKRMGGSVDNVSQQAIAYAFARGGDIPQAVREIDRYLALGVDVDIDWVRERAAEARRLKDLLLSDPPAAIRQLKEWEHQTLKAIGLDRFADHELPTSPVE